MIVTGQEGRHRTSRNSKEKNHWVILHVDVTITFNRDIKNTLSGNGLYHPSASETFQ
jgi:hypothetical protein